MLQALAILSTLTGIGVSLMMLVLLMASGANSTEKQIREIWIFFWSVVALAAISFLLALWAFVKGRYGISAAIGIAPALCCIALIVWMLITEW